MTTFSQLVDELVSEMKRPDLRTEIARYLNQTIREVHFEPETNANICYHDNLTEEQIEADSDEGFGWDIPNPARFQKMEGVLLANTYDRLGEQIWLTEKVPNRGMRGAKNFYYRASGRFVFSGYGGTGGLINLAYYLYPARLKYYESAARPASYDPEDGWTYHTDYSATAELQESAQALVSNWLLLRWHDVLAEGVRAKVFKRVSDEVRARTSYSLYTSLREGLYTGEVATSAGAW